MAPQLMTTALWTRECILHTKGPIALISVVLLTVSVASIAMARVKLVSGVRQAQ